MIEIIFNHCKLADIASIHGLLTVGTGLILIFVRMGIIKIRISELRLLHVVFGMLTFIYSIILYFFSVR